MFLLHRANLYVVKAYCIVLVSVQIDVLAVGLYTIHTYRVTVHITHDTHYTQLSQLLFFRYRILFRSKKLSQKNY